jgi:alpha-tubulin suppressor-like RCC1 family protein
MGSNADSKLGIGSIDVRSVNVPTLVEGICNIVKVACGNSHTIALGSDGSAYTWGQAFYGALGVVGGNSIQN